MSAATDGVATAAAIKPAHAVRIKRFIVSLLVISADHSSEWRWVYIFLMIRTVSFAQQKRQISELNQLPKWLKSTRTKKEQDCVPRFRYNPSETAEALWIKAERACRARAKV